MYEITIQYFDGKRRWHDFYEDKCMIDIVEILSKLDYQPDQIIVEWRKPERK